MREAERLADAGVKELLIISQDTSAYGTDLSYESSRWNGRELKARFYDLAEALGTLGVWIRLHYVYPYPHVDDIIPLMAENKILPYLDIPFQHAAPKILKTMRRPAAQAKTLERIQRWRSICPELAIRSTFIVGFPGETEKDFEQLLDWLKEAQLNRVGCFKYENVNGARSNELEAHVPEDVKSQRYDRLMSEQQKISEKILAQRIGQTIDVIIDSADEEGAIARSGWDAPEIDGNVFIDRDDADNLGLLTAGDIVAVRVIDSNAYDLWAEIPA
jgi:ribosomal protein S12 methylthiotransferase